MAARYNLSVRRGTTFARILRWAGEPIVYRPITAVPGRAPLTLTVPAHGLVDGWRAAIVGVQGMQEINAPNLPPKPAEYLKASVVDEDTVAFNAINATTFGNYTSGGVLQYYTPRDLAGYSARMDVRAKADIDSAVLLTLSTINGRIALDNDAKTIALTISAADTAALDFKRGVYDLELESPDGVITALAYGTFAVLAEVTE
jgi:hypothetical protein